MYYIQYTYNGQSLYTVSDFEDLFRFSSSCLPCSALPNSSSIVVSHQSSYKIHVSLGSWSCLCSFCTFEGLRVSWCFHSMFLKAVLCLGVVLVTLQNLFSVYFSSVIVMFLFSVLFWYLCSYCFHLVLQEVKDYPNLNFSWKCIIDYRFMLLLLISQIHS